MIYLVDISYLPASIPCFMPMNLTPDIIAFVRRQRLGYVATVNADGTPNVSPKGTLTALDEHHLIFANIASPQTLINLRERSRAEVNVLDIFSRRGYRFRCIANIIGPEQADRHHRLATFYQDIGLDLRDYEVREYVLLRVIEFAELLSPAYYNGEEEEDLRLFYYQYYKD